MNDGTTAEKLSALVHKGSCAACDVLAVGVGVALALAVVVAVVGA